LNDTTLTTPNGLVIWEAHTAQRNIKWALQNPREGADGRNINLNFDLNQTIPIDSDFAKLIAEKEVALAEYVDLVIPLLKPRKTAKRDNEGRPLKNDEGKLLLETSSSELMLSVFFNEELPMFDENGNELTGSDRHLLRGSEISMEGEFDVRINERGDKTEGRVKFYPRAIFVHKRPELKKSGGQFRRKQ
jgi:hypothetical protein